jgi:hypothetical protein
MKRRLSGSLLAACLMVSGCASSALSPYRFSPPTVSMAGLEGKTLANAKTIVQAYVASYSNAQKQNADARQVFELPPLIAAIGGVAATAFGGGPDGVLVAGTATAAFRSGNAYYAPKTKAGIYGDAIDALTCIGQIAIGAKPYELSFAMQRVGGGASVDETLVHDLIVNGVRTVEQRLTDRLSNAGSLTDAAGIAAEFEKSIKAEQDAKNKGNAANGALAAGLERDFANRAAQDAALAELTQMQEQIQQCTLRAKA